jgi:hypothetical protein
MPIKLLSFLNQEPKLSQQSLLENNSLYNEEPVGKSPKSFFILIVLILAVYLVCFVINANLDQQVKKEASAQRDLVATYTGMSEQLRQVKRADSKIKSYKQSQGEKNKLSEKIDHVTKYLNGPFTVNDLKVQSNSFEISLSGGEIFAFSQLIINYLQSGQVSQVSIKSAELIPFDNVYQVTLVGTFK